MCCNNLHYLIAVGGKPIIGHRFLLTGGEAKGKQTAQQKYIAHQVWLKRSEGEMLISDEGMMRFGKDNARIHSKNVHCMPDKHP